jgi:hypothetical protein
MSMPQLDRPGWLAQADNGPNTNLPTAQVAAALRSNDTPPRLGWPDGSFLHHRGCPQVRVWLVTTRRPPCRFACRWRGPAQTLCEHGTDLPDPRRRSIKSLTIEVIWVGSAGLIAGSRENGLSSAVRDTPRDVRGSGAPAVYCDAWRFVPDPRRVDFSALLPGQRKEDQLWPRSACMISRESLACRARSSSPRSPIWASS